MRSELCYGPRGKHENQIMTQPSGPEHRPFVPANTNMKEFTWRAVLLGLVMTVILGAANAYLGLRAGITIAATSIFTQHAFLIAQCDVMFSSKGLSTGTYRTEASALPRRWLY